MITCHQLITKLTKNVRDYLSGKVLTVQEEFDTLEEFKHFIQGYVIYYNEHRSHQGIENKKPNEKIFIKEKLLN